MAGKKKGGASMAAPKEQIDQEVDEVVSNQDIKVRIDKLFTDESRALRAVASANIGDFAVHGIRVFENERGLWASMPQSSYKDANGETKYEDIFHPVTAEAKTRLGQAVIDEYNHALELKASEPNQENTESADEEIAPMAQKM